MASTSTPNAIRTVTSDAPTGTWRHPHLDEINTRLHASTFSDANIRAILLNTILLLLTILLPALPIGRIHPSIASFLTTLPPNLAYLLWLLRTFPLCGIAYATTPLLRRKDDLSDIPLTPSQRALLGLSPSARPASPGSTYITPPRYAKSSPQRSDAGRSHSGSPFSGRDSSFGSPMGGFGGGQSPSATASPLFHKTVGREARRLSLGADSPLGMGRGGFGESLGPGTPSPSGGRGASVGLNSRWLYEKGRQSGGGRSMYA